jgi:hypothetical protein
MNSIRSLPQNHCAKCARSISASPRLSNLRVKNKSSGSLSRSPVGDSFRIPLSTNEVSTITLRLRATGAASVRSVKSSCVSNFLTRRFRSWGDAETIEEMYS